MKSSVDIQVRTSDSIDYKSANPLFSSLKCQSLAKRLAPASLQPGLISHPALIQDPLHRLRCRGCLLLGPSPFPHFSLINTLHHICILPNQWPHNLEHAQPILSSLSASVRQKHSEGYCFQKPISPPIHSSLAENMASEPY